MKKIEDMSLRELIDRIPSLVGAREELLRRLPEIEAAVELAEAVTGNIFDGSIGLERYGMALGAYRAARDARTGGRE